MRKKHLILRAAILILIPCLILSILPACQGDLRERLQAYSATYLDETFNTVLTITVGAKNTTEANRHCRAIKEIVSHLHRQFDAYTLYPGVANIAAINAAEAGTPVAVSEDVFALLSLGREVYDATDGAVHIGMGALTSLWKTAITEKTPPDAARIAEALSLSPSPDSIRLDETNRTVTRTVSGMKLDVGAIAKGYVLDKIRAYAESAGVLSLLCNLGGEILAVGSAPGGDAWEIAIANPDGGTMETIRVRNAAVASGGDYERGFSQNGTRYHHIIDPATGYPTADIRAATVILPLEKTRLSDTYSTALIVLPPSQGEALMRGLPDATYLSVMADGQVKRGEGWSAYTSE